MKKLICWAVSFLLVYSLLGISPGLAGDPQIKSSVPKPRYGGTLVWGTTSPLTDMNPVLTRHGVSMSLLGLVFNALVRTNGKGDVIPDLAESWEISSDRLEYTFHLRKGVRFHDGVECSAEDVKFTEDAIADPVNHSPWKDVEVVKGRWQVIDRYTLKLLLQEPDAYVLHKLGRAVVPRHLLQGKDMHKDPFNVHPVGTGPFRFRKWDRSLNQVELEANGQYFEGRPYLDRILVRVFPDNNSLWAALMRQEVDLVKFLNQEDYAVLSKDPLFKTYAISTCLVCVIVYDFIDPVLADIKVRQAIAMGIDVPTLLERTGMMGMQSTGPFDPDAPGFNPAVKPVSYDPVKAREILTACGWKDQDGDGLLEKGGALLELRLLVDGRNENFQRIVMVLRQQLSEIGVRLTAVPYMDENELTQDYLVSHKPRAWLRFISSSSYDAVATLERWYPSRNLSGLWHYKNSRIDELLALRPAAGDHVLPEEVSQEIQKIMYEDQPACFLFYPETLHVVASKFRNTEAFFSTEMPDYMIKNWFVQDREGK